MAADDDEARTVALLAPLARAAEFVAAHARQAARKPIHVPLLAKHMPALVHALCYDQIPAMQMDRETLAALAELGHMWCAPRLVYRCVDALLALADFWDVFDLAAEWPEATGLLRFRAIWHLPDFAAHDRAHEIIDIVGWTCR